MGSDSCMEAGFDEEILNDIGSETTDNPVFVSENVVENGKSGDPEVGKERIVVKEKAKVMEDIREALEYSFHCNFRYYEKKIMKLNDPDNPDYRRIRVESYEDVAHIKKKIERYAADKPKCERVLSLLPEQLTTTILKPNDISILSDDSYNEGLLASGEEIRKCLSQLSDGRLRLSIGQGNYVISENARLIGDDLTEKNGYISSFLIDNALGCKGGMFIQGDDEKGISSRIVIPK
jgi:hypothetical protein